MSLNHALYFYDTISLYSGITKTLTSSELQTGQSDQYVKLQWTDLRERDALGKWPMSLVERSSLSRRFVFFHPNTCLFPIYNELFTVRVSNDNSQL